MISMISSSVQLGGAIGSSLSAILIPLSGMQNIVFITILTSFVILLIQLISIRQNSKAYLVETTNLD